eukprot:scaffold85676_cov16-Prasinocladus_malaysianus.AAC.1
MSQNIDDLSSESTAYCILPWLVNGGVYHLTRVWGTISARFWYFRCAAVNTAWSSRRQETDRWPATIIACLTSDAKEYKCGETGATNISACMHRVRPLAAQ